MIFQCSQINFIKRDTFRVSVLGRFIFWLMSYKFIYCNRILPFCGIVITQVPPLFV